MSRYIKYDTALRYIKDAGMRIGGVWGIEATAHFEHEPSIDIVRCRECKYWHSNTQFCDKWSHGGFISQRTLPNDFCSCGVNSSEKPNNLSEIPTGSEKPNKCERITEDGVTCAKYPACDDCLYNPLNKVKGSERLVKGSEQTDCQTCKWWSSYGYCVHRECKGYEPQKERSSE